MDLNLCPKCNQLPTTKIKKRLIGYECAMYCNTMGCKMFWPIVVVDLSKNKAVKKAGTRWNNATENFKVELNRFNP